MQVIINFGLPRTGTTFIYQMLKQGPCLNKKITEGTRLHPCEGGYGLIELARLFNDVTFVRTYRSHEQTFASMEAAQKNGGFERFNIGDLIIWAENERFYWKNQVEFIHKHFPKVRLIELDFDALTEDDVRGIEDHPRVLAYFRQHYKKLPIREGRLRDGDHELSDELKDQIKHLPDPWLPILH